MRIKDNHRVKGQETDVSSRAILTCVLVVLLLVELNGDPQGRKDVRICKASTK